mgnify:CR=1 FL=1
MLYYRPLTLNQHIHQELMIANTSKISLDPGSPLQKIYHGKLGFNYIFSRNNSIANFINALDTIYELVHQQCEQYDFPRPRKPKRKNSTKNSL